MQFPMLACLVTLVGLVSVACAVPTISARGHPQFSLSFLNQNDPVGSFGKASFTKVDLPPKFKQFLESDTVRKDLDHTTTTFPIQWTVTKQDDTYATHLNKPVPVYAEFVGGHYCQPSYQCMAIIIDGSLGMISKKQKVVTQLGNPAIVSFNHFKTAPTLQQTPATLIEALAVHWLFNNAEVKVNGAKVKVYKALGFTGNPKMVYVDTVPDGSMGTLSFSFYGGTKCFPRSPCEVLLEHKTNPEPLGTFEAKIVRRAEVLVRTTSSLSDIDWTR